MIAVSVIIPTYNGGQYLAEALDSVCAQGSLADVECIVVDDGSIDNTLAILKDFSARMPLVIVPKRADRGWVSSTNLALERAKGKFTCFLHQDDVWLPGRLAALRMLICQYPDVDCFLTAACFIDSAGHRLDGWSPVMDVLPQIMPAPRLLERLLVQNVLAIPAPIFRTDLARHVGGLDESLWYTADWDFWLKLVLAGVVGYLPDETVGFRIHSDSQTVVRSGDTEVFRRQMEAVLDRYADRTLCGDVYVRAARFSINVNVALAAVLHGQPERLLQLVKPLLQLDWRMLHIYIAYSCIGQRVLARLRVLLSRVTSKS